MWQLLLVPPEASGGVFAWWLASYGQDVALNDWDGVAINELTLSKFVQGLLQFVCVQRHEIRSSCKPSVRPVSLLTPSFKSLKALKRP